MLENRIKWFEPWIEIDKFVDPKTATKTPRMSRWKKTFMKILVHLRDDHKIIDARVVQWNIFWVSKTFVKIEDIGIFKLTNISIHSKQLLF